MNDVPQWKKTEQLRSVMKWWREQNPGYTQVIVRDETVLFTDQHGDRRWTDLKSVYGAYHRQQVVEAHGGRSYGRSP